MIDVGVNGGGSYDDRRDWRDAGGNRGCDDVYSYRLMTDGHIVINNEMIKLE